VSRPNEFTYCEDELRFFPAGTLGNDLFLFLKQRNLPLLKHYARHDLKHVLLGYDTTEEGEACLQSLCLAMVAFHSCIGNSSLWLYYNARIFGVK
jgi:ubiquinone biosynthesis protein Coq4